MSLIRQFKNITEAKILMLEVSSGKRKALVEKMIEYFYKDYSTRPKTYDLLQEVYKKYYSIFDYVYNNWDEVEKQLPTQNLNPYQKLHTISTSFGKMTDNINFDKEYSTEEKGIIMNVIIFLTKLFKSFEQVDPTNNMKYGNWLVDVVFPYIVEHGYFNNRLSHDDQRNANLVVQEEGTFFEDLPKLEAYLGVYDEMKQKNLLPDEYRDINNVIPYWSEDGETHRSTEDPFQALNYITKNYRTTVEGDFFEIVDRNLKEGEDYEVPVKNANGYIMYLPKTQKANSILGMNTEWCTTYGEHCMNPDYQGRSPYEYEDLIILVDKNNPEEKFQFHFRSGQFMNPDDDQINIIKFLLDNRSVLEWILQIQTDQFNKWIKDSIMGEKFVEEVVEYDKYNELFETLMSELGWVQPTRRSSDGVWILEYDPEDPRVITSELEWMKNEAFYLKSMSIKDFLNKYLETRLPDVSTIDRGVFKIRVDLAPNFAKRWIAQYNNVADYNNLEMYK